MVYSLIKKWNLRIDRDEFEQIGRIAIYEAWLRYDSCIGDFAPFAYSYVSGRIKEALRENDLFGRHHVVYDPVILTGLSPLARNEEQRIILRLWIGQSRLTDEEKEYVIGEFIHGYSVKDYAERHGYHLNQVKHLRESAIKKLRQANGYRSDMLKW